MSVVNVRVDVTCTRGGGGSVKFMALLLRGTCEQRRNGRP